MFIEEFVNKLDTGQITDFSPFLEKWCSEHFRAQMVKRGILVHEALAYNEELPIVEAIRAGLMEERYEQWSTHNMHRVRKELAKRGYFPEVFVRDEDPYVRSAVFFAYPQLAEELLTDALTYLRTWETIKFSRQISLEATMTFKQLFSAENPLWTKDLTVNEQMCIVRQIREHGREFVCEHLEEYITIPQ